MVKFVGIYQLPSAIALTPSALSRSFRTNIAGRSMVLKTPGVAWGDGDRPSLTAPDIDHAPTRRGQGVGPPNRSSWDGGIPWGQIGSWSAASRTFSEAWIECVALVFALPKGSFGYLDSIDRLGPPHGGSVADLFRQVDPWFFDLLTWVGVARDHDTDHLEPLDLIEIPGRGLTIRSVESDGRVSSLSSASEVSITMSKSESVNLTTMRKLIHLVNAGTRPHDAHTLMREAHIARRRDRRRRAVIDAGTATELVLAEWNVHSNGNRQPPRGRFKTLGWYVHEATSIVPGNTMANLVQVRNDTVHKNLTPSYAQADEALKIADFIVEAIEPLPL